MTTRRGPAIAAAVRGAHYVAVGGSRELIMAKPAKPASSGRFDLLLAGGRVIDPANGRDGQFDVAVRDGKIAAVAPSIPKAKAKRVIDVSGKLVTAGLIDTHAHVYQHVAGPFGLNADEVGLKSGVSLLVDQGGPACLTIDGFRKYVVEGSDTRVRCFISTYLVGGLDGHRFVQLYSPDGINVAATVRSINANRDIVRGIKSHAEPGNYSRWGLNVLKKSKEISRETGLPVYIHLGTLWPEKDGAKVDPHQLLAEVLPLMEPGDILAHPFTRHPSGFTDQYGKVHPLVFEAIAKGVIVDVGRGSHFSLDVARAVLETGILPHTLGADLHGYNITRATAYSRSGQFRDDENPDDAAADGGSSEPAFSLHYAMSEMLALGVPLPHVIAMVTSNAAKAMREDGAFGALTVGRAADIAVMDLQSGDFTLKDGRGQELKADKRVRPVFVLKDGRVVEPGSDYQPFWEREGLRGARRSPRQRPHARAKAKKTLARRKAA
jgi:dihydroorotase